VFRRVLIASAVVLAFVAATSSASSKTMSPCRRVSNPIWSPDGTQIAYYGTRWPPPAKRHRNPNDILQALCVMARNGTNAQPLKYTVCSEKCSDPPYQIAWLKSGQLVYLIDGDFFRLTPGKKPQRFATVNTDAFATDPAGDRLAGGFGFSGCLTCGGPVTVVDVLSGHVVGKVGGKKFENHYPSLSPDGTKVVFQRDGADSSGRTFGIWTARANGSHVRRLEKVGQQPLWSPVAGKVAYIVPAGKSVALRLIAAGGGKSRVLVPRNVQNVYGWSPDGRYIAFEQGTGSVGKLAIVDVATRKVRTFLKLQYGPTAAWSPDSSQLVANWVPRNQKCWSTRRVPINGSKPSLISSCKS
jgi:Tol biopolymer transport system component